MALKEFLAEVLHLVDSFLSTAGYAHSLQLLRLYYVCIIFMPPVHFLGSTVSLEESVWSVRTSVRKHMLIVIALGFCCMV